MLVSIIIVNYNGKNYLEQCLNSLKKVDFNDFEIILVDNNSTDDSLEFVKNNYPSIIIVKLDKNRGFAEPNNMGAKIAKGKFLLFLNNDTVVTPNFITKLADVLKKNPKIAICQSLLLKPDGSIDSSGDFIDKIGIVYNSKTRIKEIREISTPRAASMMIRKEIFSKLGGFDEKFYFSFEDVDLGWRTWILGYNVVVVPESVVYHSVGKTTHKLKPEAAFHGLKNQLSMKITNFEPKFVLKSMFSFFFIYGFREVRIWLDYKIKGSTRITSTDYEEKIAEKPSIIVVLKSLIWLCKNLGYLRRKHKKVNASRAMSTLSLQKIKIISNEKQ